MPRNPIQDIVPKGRSIRNVPLPSHRTRTEVRVKETVVEEPEVAQEIRYESRQETRHESRVHAHDVHEEFDYSEEESVSTGSGKKWIIGGSVFAALALVFVISTIFHGATLSVTPRTQVATINDAVTASKSSATAGLSFQPKVIKQTGSVQLKATGEKQVSTQASGTIIIYNNYNATAQRLVKNTRFETPEGLIFRIADSVTVPGKNGSTPGSVEAVVYADEAGDKYNVGLKDFTIPGFKGDPRYNAFYAKSKPSSPLAGGFQGTVRVVSDADMTKAQADIKTRATVELLKQVEAQVPEGSVFFSGAHTVSCTTLPQENVSSTEVLVKMECTLSAAFFDTQKLSEKLASLKVAGYQNDPVIVRDIRSLSFTPRDGFDPAAETVAFSLQGDAQFEWLYDEAAFKQKLAGAKSSDVPSITQGFPMIEKVEASIRPFWRKTFPADVSDITVKKAI